MDLPDAFVILGVTLLLIAFVAQPALVPAAIGLIAIRYGLNRSRR